jgi:hypothetical protein
MSPGYLHPRVPQVGAQEGHGDVEALAQVEGVVVGCLVVGLARPCSNLQQTAYGMWFSGNISVPLSSGLSPFASE